jgi:orotate phosphoribosyltransferase-like protein
MSKFKRLVEAVLELQAQGLSDAEIATALQCGRSVVEYIIAVYTEASVDAVWGAV